MIRRYRLPRGPMARKDRIPPFSSLVAGIEPFLCEFLPAASGFCPPNLWTTLWGEPAECPPGRAGAGCQGKCCTIGHLPGFLSVHRRSAGALHFLWFRRCLRRGSLRFAMAKRLMRRSRGETSRPGAEGLALAGQRSRSAAGCALRATALRCSVWGRGAELAALRFAPLRSDSGRRVRQRSALRAPPPALRCSPLTMSRQGKPLRPGWQRPGGGTNSGHVFLFGRWYRRAIEAASIPAASPDTRRRV